MKSRAGAEITVAGAGILGLWQALTLARRGFRVRLVEASSEPFAAAASRYAGAMLLPYSEGDTAPPLAGELGRRGVVLWRETYPGLVARGSLVVAPLRGQPELRRLAALTSGHDWIGEERIGDLEPDLAGRFTDALFYPDEAHMTTPAALTFLLETARNAGCDVEFGCAWDGRTDDGITIDCRGMAAATELRDLRGVRGERLVIRSREVTLTRPIRLLHPRHGAYVVPWGDGRYVVGATEIESDEAGPVTVRSALELLGSAFAIHPAFGEAEILDMGAGVRPAFSDNLPRIVVREGGRRILVNGAYRHGFLFAPVLAEKVAALIETGTADDPIVRRE